jgi:uncharacterized membrane protein YeaQ/YmgE (transglycosylase-associated protein family)
MPGKIPGGLLVTLLLGIAGSFVAGFLGRMIGMYRDPGSGPGIIMSTIGAIVLLGIYRLAIHRRLGRTDTRGPGEHTTFPWRGAGETPLRTTMPR